MLSGGLAEACLFCLTIRHILCGREMPDPQYPSTKGSNLTGDFRKTAVSEEAATLRDPGIAAFLRSARSVLGPFKGSRSLHLRRGRV